MLAQTYDAEVLQSLQTVGVRPDTDKARQFYQAAAAAGIEQAKERLRALNSTDGKSLSSRKIAMARFVDTRSQRRFGGMHLSFCLNVSLCG